MSSSRSSRWLIRRSRLHTSRRPAPEPGAAVWCSKHKPAKSELAVKEQFMAAATAAEQSLRDGDPFVALKHLQNEVRAKPADAKLRVFLFQLLSVLGQWDRAL